MDSNVGVVEILQSPVPQAQDVVNQSNKGILSGAVAEKSHEATNGVYFLSNEKKVKVGVLKPENEEKRDHMHRKEGYKALREVSAFLLDFPKSGEESGFGGVPPTTMVQCSGFKNERIWRRGSLQAFVPKKKWFVAAKSEDAFGLDDFQRLSVTDMRYGNEGRHHLNILMSKEGKLIPIDHGDCFPGMNGNYRFDWMEWSHAKEPYSPEVAGYVASLSFEKAFETLKNAGIELSDEEWYAYQLRQLVLKIGVRNGHVPKDMARLLVGYPYGYGVVGLPNSLYEIYELCRNLAGGESAVFGETGRLIEYVLNEIKRERLAKKV